MTFPGSEWESLGERIISCRKCPRLVSWREEVARRKRRAYLDFEYWGKPVPGFGDFSARVLVVGLAPGAHGANRTGRMFTGDGSGEFLFRALYKAGFANQAESMDVSDGLEAADLYISAICRCAPPGNKPTPEEIDNCSPYLEQEIRLLPRLEAIVALGRLAFTHTLQIYRKFGHSLQRVESGYHPKIQTVSRLHFVHGAVYPLGEDLPQLIASYHPSRQNTQTGRLTEAMFDSVWETARAILSATPRPDHGSVDI
jgi:uracil-DNA glycosylase family 4